MLIHIDRYNAFSRNSRGTFTRLRAQTQEDRERQ
jgi:hypothetical protein